MKHLFFFNSYQAGRQAGILKQQSENVSLWSKRKLGCNIETVLHLSGIGGKDNIHPCHLHHWQLEWESYFEWNQPNDDNCVELSFGPHMPTLPEYYSVFQYNFPSGPKITSVEQWEGNMKPFKQ